MRARDRRGRDDRPGPRGHDRPVRRRAALAGMALGALLVWGLGAFVAALGHPLPTAPPSPATEPESDPREDVECAADPAGGTRTRAPAGGPVRAVSSNMLYACPEDFHGSTVRYAGEVVGAVLHRRDGAWVQLNDDVYAGGVGPLPAHREFRGGNAGVGVLLPRGVADRVAFVGGPTARGDVVEVTGTFERVDRASGEVAVIRAAQARVVRVGEPIEPRPLPDRQVAAYAAVLLAAGLTVAGRVARRGD